jgi:(R,R)-butanediol dehydrogenase / meso-butanediol dehydrogenase / diacetyl reductase
MSTIGRSSMRAAVFHGRRDVRLEQMPVPRPGPGELLLRVSAVGVCGTDAAEWAHGPALYPVRDAHRVTGHHGPIIPGHEFSGTVVAAGVGVADTWLGELVASCGSVSCTRCAACRSGHSNQCSDFNAVGLHRHGALAEYVVTPADNCLAVGTWDLTGDEAALAQPMAIAVHAVSRAGVRTGERALVQGVGGVGAFLVHALVEAGVEVVAADRDARRLAVAQELGASVACLVGGTDDVAALHGAGETPVVFEVSGSARGLQTALALLPVGGRLVVVGIQESLVEVAVRHVTLREQTVIGTNALVREVDFPRAIELVATRRGRWSCVAPVVHPLDDLVDAVLAPIVEGRPPAIKALIDPGAGARRTVMR